MGDDLRGATARRRRPRAPRGRCADGSDDARRRGSSGAREGGSWTSRRGSRLRRAKSAVDARSSRGASAPRASPPRESTATSHRRARRRARGLRKGDGSVLVATDVAARGLDVEASAATRTWSALSEALRLHIVIHAPVGAGMTAAVDAALLARRREFIPRRSSARCRAARLQPRRSPRARRRERREAARRREGRTDGGTAARRLGVRHQRDEKARIAIGHPCVIRRAPGGVLRGTQAPRPIPAGRASAVERSGDWSTSGSASRDVQPRARRHAEREAPRRGRPEDGVP